MTPVSATPLDEASATDAPFVATVSETDQPQPEQTDSNVSTPPPASKSPVETSVSDEVESEATAKAPDSPTSTTESTASPSVSATQEPTASPKAPASSTPTEETPAKPTVEQRLAPTLLAAGTTCNVTQKQSQILGGFELDGNLCANNGAYDDWSSVLQTPSGNDGLSDGTQFTSGAKETTWPWDSKATSGRNTATGQGDIGRNYAYSTSKDGHVYAFLGFERATSSGSIRYSVELNAKPNDPAVIATPDRSDGDLLLTIEQNGNGDFSLVSASIWNSVTHWVKQPTLGGVIGVTNDVAIPGFDGTYTIPQRGFAEIGVDLTALFGPATCTGNYGTMNLRSLSSTQDSSSLGDWVAPIAVKVPSTCSSVIVDKKWVIDGKEFDNGKQPSEFSASLDLTGQSTPQFGVGYTKKSNNADYEAKQEITIGEVVNEAKFPVGCTNVASGDLGKHILEPGVNSYTVVNTVSCTNLTLEKKVIGQAAATDWTLTAAGPTSFTGTTGTKAVTNVPVLPGKYVIDETDGPAGYQLTDLTCKGAVVDDENTITVTAGSKVTCVLTNTQEIELIVTKKWVVNGKEFAHGKQPVGDARLTVDGKDTGFGDSIKKYLIGDEVAIAETSVGTMPELCKLTSSTIDGVEGTSAKHTMTQTPTPNVVAVVNTVECEQLLTLVKVVDNQDFSGTSTTNDWTLTAAGMELSDQVISGKTKDASITKASVEVGTYKLSEEGTAKGYQNGTWSCEGTGSTEGENITLELGQQATCTIVNTALPGSAVWTKTNPEGDLLAGAQWTVIGPESGKSETIIVEDCMAEGCTGPDMDPAKGKFSLTRLKWGSYTLQETTAPPGYIKDDKIYSFEVSGDALDIELAAIKNEQQAGPELPLTGGIGRDQIYLIGGGILVLGLSFMGIRNLRTRRRNLG